MQVLRMPKSCKLNQLIVLLFVIIVCLLYRKSAHWEEDIGHGLMRSKSSSKTRFHESTGGSVYFDNDGYLRSALSPNRRWCSQNPFLKANYSETVSHLEQSWIEWKERQLISTLEVLKNYAVSGGKMKDDMIDLAYPTSSPLPCTTGEEIVRIGGRSDGNKLICGVETMRSLKNCVIYSLGSFNNFRFEKDIIEKTGCRIHTYDCTSNPPRGKLSGLTFHKVCLGDTNPLQKFMHPYSKKKTHSFLENASLFERFHVLMEKNAHKEVHLLKIDIEGGEYSVFADISDPRHTINLPYQIVLESHWWNRDIYHAILHNKVFSQLWQMGYRVLTHDFNPGDHTCVEWTLIRVFC